MKGFSARSRALAVALACTASVAFACTACLAFADAQPAAAAVNPLRAVCGVASVFSGLAGKACSAVQNGGRLADAGEKLLSGHIGGAVKSVLGGSKAASTATTAIGLAAITAWVLGGAKVALHETVQVLGKTTTPQLGSTWFSSTYWRMAGIAAVLTLPFLFAASIQALMRSDLALLVRAAFGYLPLSMLAISVAAPVTTLLLAVSDELSAAVSSAAGNSGAQYLAKAGGTIGGLTVIAGSPFLAVLIGVALVAGALTLWIELLMREAAVYVIVLMLPLVFAAFVWPARRIWAIRAIELLVALILSKFAIIAVLSLGGAALTSGLSSGIAGWVAGVVLLSMGAFAPWALLRLVPLSELASSAAGPLRGEMRALEAGLLPARGYAGMAEGWVASKTAEMRREADQTAANGSADPGRPANVAADGAWSVADLPAAPAEAAPGESEAAPGEADVDGMAEEGMDGVARAEVDGVAEAADDGTGDPDDATTQSAPGPAGADGAPDGRVRKPPAAAPADLREQPRASDRTRDVRTLRADLPAVALGLEGSPPTFPALLANGLFDVDDEPGKSADEAIPSDGLAPDNQPPQGQADDQDQARGPDPTLPGPGPADGQP